MQVRRLGLLIVAACGAKAPQPSRGVDNAGVATPTAKKRAFKNPRYVSAPRPDIDMTGVLPDFHEELRWPLSGMNHPVLEPRFPIASELAIGIERAMPESPFA